MNLSDVSAFEVARLAAAAGLGWGLARAIWGAISGVMAATIAHRHDDTPPGPPAAA